MALYIDCVLPKNILQLCTQDTWRQISQYLLARANITSRPKVSETKLWFDLLDIPWMEKIPTAALTGLADQLNIAKDYWLRADPKNLVVKGAQFFDQPFLFNELNVKKIAVALEKLRTLFSDYLITLHTPCFDRWYLSMPFDPSLETEDIAALQQGISTAKWLGERLNPQSSAYIPWKKLFTEVQMLLHQAELPFNSLWFWGGGFLPAPSIVRQHHNISPIVKKVWSNVPLIKGLASLKNDFVDQNLQNWKQTITRFSSDQQCLFIFESPSNEEMLHFFQELVEMLKTHNINKLRLHDGQGHVYSSTPYTIRRFWRYTIPTI